MWLICFGVRWMMMMNVMFMFVGVFLKKVCKVVVLFVDVLMFMIGNDRLFFNVVGDESCFLCVGVCCVIEFF